MNFFHTGRQVKSTEETEIVKICDAGSTSEERYSGGRSKLEAEYFLFYNFFEKKTVFSEKTVWKTDLGAHLTIF